jgi:hypothetical protein
MADRKRIGLREVRALGPDAEIWDAAVPGFGARRQKGAAVSYVLMYRTREGRQRRFTIGRHGKPWTFPASLWNGEVRPKAALRRHRLPADTEADALKGLKELWSIPVIGFGKRDPLMELTQCRKW